jgi:hypothetical protein
VEASKTTKWNFGTNTVKEDMTFYGEWKQIKYTVTFNTGAGGSIVLALEVPHGSAVWRNSLRDFAV